MTILKIPIADKSITLSIVWFPSTAVSVDTISVQEKANRFFLAWYCHFMKYLALIRIHHWSCKSNHISHIILLVQNNFPRVRERGLIIDWHLWNRQGSPTEVRVAPPGWLLLGRCENVVLNSRERSIWKGRGCITRVTWRFLSNLSALRKPRSHDNERQSCMEPGA